MSQLLRHRLHKLFQRVFLALKVQLAIFFKRAIANFAKIFGKIFSIITCLYTSGMLAHFILKSMASLVPPVDSSGRPPVIERHWVLLGIAGTQFIVAIFLGAWY